MQRTFFASLALAAFANAACDIPEVNSATVNLISEFEGFRADIYTDPTGNPTVGYGHLCADSSCSDVSYPIPLSQANGKALLADDLYTPEECITMMTNSGVTLNLNEFGALVSWAFNMGCGAARGSTLVKRLNAGEEPQTVIAQELPKWVYGNGEVLPGLVRRRDAEVDLAQTATSAPALPACS
ncbi:lysozyme [Microdochium trichocladiopsis]|uniref:Lysozyme n=1 Tax=Microdochium trichocladiopsis TaxID=1682393 RepID=A0A9P8XRU3_9PEZI|nr:lysozyme [Microdochium trichocladiopsis]KAH7014243.1 lysozyme [Microdochium trichocladiopsis]